MCEICQRSVCLPRCPNASVSTMGTCAQCHAQLMSDDEYLVDDNENIFCDMDCVADFYGIKSIWES